MYWAYGIKQVVVKTPTASKSQPSESIIYVRQCGFAVLSDQATGCFRTWQSTGADPVVLVTYVRQISRNSFEPI